MRQATLALASDELESLRSRLETAEQQLGEERQAKAAVEARCWMAKAAVEGGRGALHQTAEASAASWMELAGGFLDTQEGLELDNVGAAVEAAKL